MEKKNWKTPLICCWKFIWYSTSIFLFRLLKWDELSLEWKMKNDWSIDGLTSERCNGWKIHGFIHYPLICAVNGWSMDIHQIHGCSWIFSDKHHPSVLIQATLIKKAKRYANLINFAWMIYCRSDPINPDT